MNLKIRRLLSAALVLALMVSILPVLGLSVKASAAETENTETAQFVFYYDISPYRTSTEAHAVNNDASYSLDAVYNTYPAKEGYVFAGWFTNPDSTAPLDASIVKGGAFAKFVPEALMKTVAQVSTKTNYDTASSALRFVAAVDGLEYSQIGFLLNREGSERTYTHATTTVYTTLSGVVEGGSLTPAYFHENATHMFALTLSGIKDQSANYVATPFWITQDGTKVDHIPTANKSVKMGVDANVAAGKTQLPAVDTVTETTAWYNEEDTEFTLNTLGEFKGFITLSQSNTFEGKTIKLATDIVWNEGDASQWATTPPANAWTPIGEWDNGFMGVFDGQGHTISGIYCKTGGYAAVVARLYGAKAAVKNLRVVNSYFESEGTVDFHNGAGVVGRATNGYTVANVYTAAYFKGVKAVGLVSFSDGGVTNIKNCWFDGTIVGAGAATNIGGMIGAVPNSQTHNITNCLMTGTISGSSAYAGGLVGIGPWSCVIKATGCLVAGDMTGVTSGVVGSVVGNNPGGNKSVYTNVYATAETHQNLKGGGGATFTATAVAEADILGDTAVTTLSGLTFGTSFVTREEEVPGLNTWYNADATTLYIHTAEDLYAFSKAQEAANFAGKTILLTADITLNEGDAADWAETAPANMWDPVGMGDASLSFEGTFDGQGHTISGLYYDSALYGGGLFVYTGSNATIQNLKITNSYIRSTYGAEWSATGSVAAFVNGTKFINIYSDAIIDTNSGYTGGIGGRVQGNGVTVENCEYAGTITGTGDYAKFIGGIFGGFNSNTASASVVNNSKFSGDITGNMNVGGLAGKSSGVASTASITVDGFCYTGTSTAYNTTDSSSLGGVFGLAENISVTIEDSTVGGVINATLGIGGGFIGFQTSSNVTIDNSVYNGTLNGGTKLAGFVARVNTAGYTATITDSVFAGTITGTSTSESTIGGFVGNVNNGNVSLYDCISEGTLIAAGPYAAGAIAQIMNVAGVTIIVDNVISTADIQNASSNAGGIIARVMGANPSVTVKNTLAMATFKTDTWCTAQTIAHAQENAVKMENNFFVQTANAAANGIESSGSNVTAAPVKVNEGTLNYLIELYTTSNMRPDYDGFKTSGFQISDAADLFGFNIYNEVHGFSGKTATLTKDIVVNTGDASTWQVTGPAYNWRPVGAISGPGTFAGTFNGQGYTISGIYCSYASGNGLGMFREVTSTGAVKNIKLTNSFLENTVESNYGYNAGIVAYLNGGTVYRVYTDAYIHTVDSYAGGIVGFTAGTTANITECVFDGLLLARCELHSACANTAQSSTRGHAKYVGGIVGAATATNNNITGCVISGKIMNQCVQAHRTGGIVGGVPNAGKNVTIMSCMSLANFATFGHSNNSYHFNMVMDCRSETSDVTKPTNIDTLYSENYVLSQYLYNAAGVKLNSGSTVTGAYNSNTTTIRYSTKQMITDIDTRFAEGTSFLDFTEIWTYKSGQMPVLRWLDTERVATPYYLTIGDDQLLCLEMTGENYDSYKDAELKETLLTGQYNDNGWQLYSLAYEYADAIAFKDIDYAENAYITKYISTTLEDYTWYISQMKTAGFEVVASNIINTDDAYYTALTYKGFSYSVTFFANTGETYVTASNEMKFSPFMNSEYYKTADDNDPAKTTYSDITVTMVELRDGGMCQVIRLKNGHYIVIDGGTGTTPAGTTVNGVTYDTAAKDRAELAAALGAEVRPIYNSLGDVVGYEEPQVIVDAWIFTHDHADHIGWLRGGVYGAMQVDVYVKGFYYNFTDDFRVDAEFTIGDNTVQGYGNVAYAYEDSNGTNSTNRYYKGSLDNGPFWVEYTADHKMANNVNTPSWGEKGIPIYRLQAGQKYYFDGVTLEVPYTQDQSQPSEYKMDINGSCAWLLFTDDHGNTYLEAGDTETWNQDAVIELYDDYYDGGSGPNYALFGADLVNAFHHGLNLEINGTNDHTRLNILFGVQNSNGNPATANSVTNGNDGRTKFIFYTRGYLNSIFGYVSNTSSWNSRNMRANHYLTGYVYPGLISSSLSKAKAYPNLASPIAFSSYCTKPDDKGYSWQGTTVVSFSASGISWNKQETNSIYK